MATTSHFFPSKDPNSTQTAPYTSEKVIEIFESPYTEQLNDRKANAIIKFCKERRDGFYYEELTNLIKMVNYAVRDLIEIGVVEMNAALRAICECASAPFKKNRTSDELEFVPVLPVFLNCFKPLMITSHQAEIQQLPDNKILPNLRYGVIRFLKAFCEEGIDEILKMEESLEDSKKKSPMLEASPMQRLLMNGTKNLRAIDKSDLVEDIIFTMQFYAKNYEFLLPLLDMISNCVLYKNLAQKFSNFGILKDIIYVIFECEDFRSYIVKSCFEIIWNAIEAVGVNSIKLFAAEDIIVSLKRLFENIMKNGYKLEDKCLRNELLILINYLMTDEKALYYFYEKQSIPSVQSPATFLDILLFYATIDEMTFYNEPIKTNNLRSFFTTTSEDLEFKKLIWSGVLTAVQANQTQILDAVKNSPFTMSLLLYIDPLANSYAVNRWSAPQLREIQLHCLSILSNVILYMKDDFYEKNGLFCLTKFLTNNNDAERREKCLRAFNNASLFDEAYKLKITEEGVLDNLIDLLQQENENPIEIKELCFSIISNLCKECNKNKKLFRQKGGVDLIVNSLKDPNVSTSTRYALYTVSILDCLWNAILGNKKSETVFLDNEGMYVLLEFLEVCDEIHKKMALSCLSYLIENPKAIPYFCDWNSSRTMINATQLLIKVYEKEDVKHGVKYDDGIIVHYDRPLNPKTKKINRFSKLATAEEEEMKTILDLNGKYITKMVSKKPHPSSSKGFQRLKEALIAGDSESDAGTEAYLIKSIKEKVEEYDLRAIVFCILYRTGFDRNELLAPEKQKIEVIQMYPHFKIGEIWTDIKTELEEENVKPTSDDHHWMMTCIEEFKEMVLNVINTQSLIAREYKNMQEEDLYKFYEIIKSNKLAK